jgi:hypothetical protein
MNQKTHLVDNKYLKLLYITLVISIISVAQLKAEMFSIMLDWQQGTMYEYSLTESHIVYVNKKPVRSNIQRSKISVEFYRISDDYNKLRWKYTDIEYDLSRVNDYLYKSLYKLSKILYFDIITDKHGDYQYLINWEQIRDIGTVFIDSVISKLPEHYKDKELASARKSLNTIKTQYVSHESIESTLLHNIQIFFQAYSYNYDNTGPIEQDAVMQNPVTKKMVSGKLIRLGIVDKKEKKLKIDIKQLVSDSVKAQGFDKPQLLELLFKTSVDIDTRNGSVRDLSYSRQVVMGNKEDAKTVFIRRLSK